MTETSTVTDVVLTPEQVRTRAIELRALIERGFDLLADRHVPHIEVDGHVLYLPTTVSDDGRTVIADQDIFVAAKGLGTEVILATVRYRDPNNGGFIGEQVRVKTGAKPEVGYERWYVDPHHVRVEDEPAIRSNTEASFTSGRAVAIKLPSFGSGWGNTHLTRE